MEVVQDLSDDQIREILVSHGEPNTPVNSLTRAVLLRKVAQLLHGGGGGGGAAQSPATISADKNSAQQKKFDSEANVRRFVAEQQGTSKANVVSSEKANGFPSLFVPALNKFRKFIEEGDVDKFTMAVWENPRYLIGCGDTPEILKPPSRYNALHCAVRSGCLPIVKNLFEILEGDLFWSLVYPDDNPEIRNRRRNFLVDRYLNTCDRGVSF